MHLNELRLGNFGHHCIKFTLLALFLSLLRIGNDTFRILNLFNHYWNSRLLYFKARLLNDNPIDIVSFYNAESMLTLIISILIHFIREVLTFKVSLWITICRHLERVAIQYEYFVKCASVRVHRFCFASLSHVAIIIAAVENRFQSFGRAP